MALRQVPVTVVSGFIGVGKSTLIGHLRKSLGSRRPAFLHDDGETDLLDALKEAVEMQGADVVVIESSCHAEPYFLAEELVLGSDEEPPIRNVRLDTLLTVIDAEKFLDDIAGGDDVSERLSECDPEDDRTVAEILVEQIEFADVIVINKIDLTTESRLARTEALLERLNPRAQLLRSVKGAIETSEAIATGLFDIHETDEGAGWLAELEGQFADEEPSVAGVVSFTYDERRPFHPVRFNELLDDFDIPGLVRGKGSIWIASRHHDIGVWSLAGRTSTLSYGGAWFAATPAREWPQDERERAEIMTGWMPPFGDRRQEIAFIGIDLNERTLRRRLDACLLTSAEMVGAPDIWSTWNDPLPDWHAEAEPDPE